jgi:drug/metabolite transporter (DMT)-like permease
MVNKSGGLVASYKGLLYAGFTAFLWGFLAIALKLSLNTINPVSVVWFRFTIAFLVLSFLMTIFDRSFVTVFIKPPLILFAAAVFLGFNYYGFITGIHQTTPSNAQVFIQVGPVSLAFIGLLVFKEKINWKHLIGFVVLLFGLSLFYTQQLAELAGTRGDYSKGITYIVLGGFSWALFSSFQKVLVRKFKPNHLNVFIYGFCSLMFLPFVEFDKIPQLVLGEWLLLVFLGLNTVFAYGSLALALKYAEANKVSVILTMNPIITFSAMALLELAAVSWIEFERFTFLSIAGALLVFGGALLVILSGYKKQDSGQTVDNKNL